MCNHMHARKRRCADHAEWKKLCRQKDRQPWESLKAILAGQDEWEDRAKRFKLGVGSIGALAAKGTCSK